MNATLLHFSIVTGLAAWSLLLFLNWDWMKQGGFNRLFTVLATVHIFRYVGLIALVPTHLDGHAFGMSQAYLAQVAWGDFVAAWLAVAAIVAIQKEWRYAMWLVWAFAIAGTADTLNAGPNFAMHITDQNQVGAMGWLILTIYVPALVVTESTLAFALGQKVLCWLSNRRESATASTPTMATKVAT